MSKKSAFITALISVPLAAMSQEVEMADSMRENGKIYVVVVVLSIVIAGLYGYLFYLDRKINRLEKKSAGK